MSNKHKGTNFEDFLKEQNIDINDKDVLIELLNNYQKLCGQKTVDNFELIKELQQYKQCLNEIAEIIDDVGDDNYLLIREKILVKIDEVKGNE